MIRKPYSSKVLAIAGFILSGMGIYFIFLRSSLLPEDLNYMGSTMENVKQNIPGLLNWLQKVFVVMGGYIFTTGLLTIFIAYTSFQIRASGVFAVVVCAGISSIGLMTFINFILVSDFKWLLLAFTMIWALALVLYRINK